MEEFDKPKKEHRKRQSGKKAEKKKDKSNSKLADDEKSMRERNPKAFSIQNVGKTERRVRRKEDIDEKRYFFSTFDFPSVNF